MHTIDAIWQLISPLDYFKLFKMKYESLIEWYSPFNLGLPLEDYSAQEMVLVFPTVAALDYMRLEYLHKWLYFSIHLAMGSFCLLYLHLNCFWLHKITEWE